MSETRQAELSTSNGTILTFEGVTAVGSLHGRMLEMSLQQRFRNSGELNTELTYTFPLPWGAVLMGIDVELSGQHLNGVVTAKKEARSQYEEALSEGNTSIMLERNADFSYTLELGNLLAHEACVVTVRYAQVLQVEQSQLRLMLPTTISPRYGNQLTQGGLQPHQVVETDLTVEYPFDVSIALHGELAKTNVACLSHNISYIPGTDILTVKLARKGALDRDFVLVLSELQQESVAIASPDHWCTGRTAVIVSFSPTLAIEDTRPVAVKILVDCSGSMAGDSIAAARTALHAVVSRLDQADKFTLSRFGSQVEHRSLGLWSGTKPAKASGLRWVQELQADLGGTEMATALVSTVALADEGRADILLITDGEIEGIEEVIDLAKRSGHRVFVVGIGASPAEAHLRRLSLATGGACDFVAPGEDVEPAVVRMFNRLRSARVHGLRVQWPSEWKIEWSNDLPDLAFDGDTLNLYAVVAGEASALAGGHVTLLGQSEGKGELTTLARAQVSLANDEANAFSRMVAFSKYQQLADGESAGVAGATAAVDLAVSYQLVTDETNFVLIHERAANEKPVEMPQPHNVRHMLSAGWGGTGLLRAPSRAQPARPSAFRPTALPMASFDSGPHFDAFAAFDMGPAMDVSAHLDAGLNSQVPAFLAMESERMLTPSAERPRIDMQNPDHWTLHVTRLSSAKEVLQSKQSKSGGPSQSNYSGLTPAGLSEWLRINDFGLWPKNFLELREIGLGLSVCEWLEFVVGEEHRSASVVQAFLLFVYGVDFRLPPVQAASNLADVDTPARELLDLVGASDVASAIRQGLDGMVVRVWPDRVVNFAEVADAR